MPNKLIINESTDLIILAISLGYIPVSKQDILLNREAIIEEMERDEYLSYDEKIKNTPLRTSTSEIFGPKAYESSLVDGFLCFSKIDKDKRFLENFRLPIGNNGKEIPDLHNTTKALILELMLSTLIDVDSPSFRHIVNVNQTLKNKVSPSKETDLLNSVIIEDITPILYDKHLHEHDIYDHTNANKYKKSKVYDFYFDDYYIDTHKNFNPLSNISPTITTLEKVINCCSDETQKTTIEKARSYFVSVVSSNGVDKIRDDFAKNNDLFQFEK